MKNVDRGNVVWECWILREWDRAVYMVTSVHLLLSIELFSAIYPLCRSQLPPSRPGDQNETVLRMNSQLSKLL
jgi:hypothetical protein